MQKYKNILQFDVCKEDKIFTVIFETISRERNLLNDVILDGFHLDTYDLQRTHFELYSEIKNRMKEMAKHYWDLKEPLPPLSTFAGQQVFDALADLLNSSK